MSDDLEKEIALYEAERNRAWHSWFAARGDVSPSDENTRIFDCGFRMAWELCRTQATAPQPAAMPPEIPRELLGTIIDEVFDGAVEDVGIIEDIYRAIARRFVEKPAEQQPSAQKPVGFVSQDFLEGKWSLDHIAKSDEGQISRTIPVFAKPPQPAEQQPAPDVSALVAALVEALTELCDEIDKHEIHAAISKTSISWFKRKARKALAAHRKQEEAER